MAPGGQDKPANSTAPTVFVSYAHVDRARTRPIVEALAAHGYKVWWDRLVAGGAAFADETEKALEAADIILVLWSANSIHSHWVRDEATRGRDRGCMVPVSIDGSEPPLGFRQLQYIDLSHWHGAASAPAFRELLAAMESCGCGETGEQLAFAAPAHAQPVISRRALLAVGGTGVLLAGGGWAAWTSNMFAPAPTTNSVAVMPFKNLSGSAEQDYFSDGLSEELRATLSLNRRLEVAARTSSDVFRDGEQTAATIASRLGVAFILEGSVRRDRQGLRITARLVDGSTGFESWSEIFDRPAEDVITVQREIAATVADALTSTISDGEAGGAERIGGTSNARAFDAYLKGVALYELAASEATDRQALAAFEEALSLDPEYAAAHAARSRALTVIGSSFASGEELQDYYAKAMEAARRAIDLAPDMAEGHAALGLVLMNGRLDVAAAAEPYQRSFDLGYGNANILRGFSDFATHVGRFDEARQAIARAKRLDPLNFLVFRSAALTEFSDREYGAAAREVRTGLSLNPEGSGLKRILGDIALVEGRNEEARQFFTQEPSVVSRQRGLAIVEARLSGQEQGEEILTRMISDFGKNSLYQQGQVFAQLGRKDEAISALEEGLAAGDSGLVLARNDPLLDPIRQDARFKAILTRLGFDEA